MSRSSRLKLEKPTLIRALTVALDTVPEVPASSEVQYATHTLDERFTELPEIVELDELEEKDAEYNKFKHLMFVSDTKLTDNIRKQLDKYDGIVEFDSELFANRNIEELLGSHTVNHIWVDLRSTKARGWVGFNLPKNDSFDIICVYSNGKLNKWIKDMEPHAEMTIKLAEISKLKSLTMGELVDKISAVNIHEPTSILASLLGCGASLSKKKRTE